jgi:hypothetical protein
MMPVRRVVIRDSLSLDASNASSFQASISLQEA